MYIYRLRLGIAGAAVNRFNGVLANTVDEVNQRRTSLDASDGDINGIWTQTTAGDPSIYNRDGSSSSVASAGC